MRYRAAGFSSGIFAHKEKDVDASTEETATGIDLVNGPFFAPLGKEVPKV